MSALLERPRDPSQVATMFQNPPVPTQTREQMKGTPGRTCREWAVVPAVAPITQSRLATATFFGVAKHGHRAISLLHGSPAGPVAIPFTSESIELGLILRAAAHGADQFSISAA